MNTIATGISYNQLKSKLECNGYDLTNDCIELAVKQWFFDCFHHRDERDKPVEKVTKIDKHLDCNFILRGESCLTLVEYKKSKRNLTVAWLSFLVAIIAIMVSLIQSLSPKSDESLSKQVKIQEQQVQLLQDLVKGQNIQHVPEPSARN